MPKENVYERPSVTALEEAEKAGQPPAFAQKRRVSVGWSRDCWVQIGVGWVDETAEPTGVASDEVILSGETDEHRRVWQSQWMGLDRHGINELIRKLRRARDAVFGKDE